MRLGILLRNMGPQSLPATLRACAMEAEAAGLDDLWVVDHLAIAPDAAEGSGGRYLEALATLAYLAGITTRIGLGVSVLIAPYRPPLVTAKWVASVQELAHGRLQLGVGVGWMATEFRALGVDRRRRGALTDELLALLHECFAQDVVIQHGQPFIFAPRPTRPPLLLGGTAEHAFARIVRYGDGWMPMTGDPAALREPVQHLTQLLLAAGRPAPVVIPLTTLPLDDPPRARDLLAELAALGATGVMHTGRYADADEFAAMSAQLQALR
jgi:probable F420-dependent oxidoreductase